MTEPTLVIFQTRETKTDLKAQTGGPGVFGALTIFSVMTCFLVRTVWTTSTKRWHDALGREKEAGFVASCYQITCAAMGCVPLSRVECPCRQIL